MDLKRKAGATDMGIVYDESTPRSTKKRRPRDSCHSDDELSASILYQTEERREMERKLISLEKQRIELERSRADKEEGRIEPMRIPTI